MVLMGCATLHPSYPSCAGVKLRMVYISILRLDPEPDQYPLLRGITLWIFLLSLRYLMIFCSDRNYCNSDDSREFHQEIAYFLIGIRTLTTVPCCGTLVISIRPPSTAVRSRIPSRPNDFFLATSAESNPFPSSRTSTMKSSAFCDRVRIPLKLDTQSTSNWTVGA